MLQLSYIMSSICLRYKVKNSGLCNKVVFLPKCITFMGIDHIYIYIWPTGMWLGNSSHIFFWPWAINSHFPRWPLKKLLGRITYQPLVGLHSNLIGYSLVFLMIWFTFGMNPLKELNQGGAHHFSISLYWVVSPSLIIFFWGGGRIFKKKLSIFFTKIMPYVPGRNPLTTNDSHHSFWWTDLEIYFTRMLLMFSCH